MQIAELKFGDVGRGLSRYRPVVLAVGAIVVMGLVLPGPKRVAGNLFDVESFDAGAAPVAALAAPETIDGAGGVVPAEAAEAVSQFEASPGSFAGSFSSPIAPDTTSSFDVDASATRPDDDDRAATSPTFSSSAPAATTTTRPPSLPLTVVASAWSSAQAGTPLASAGVPDGSLPVGRRAGFEQDKVAFVRLTGNMQFLKLSPHPDTSGQRAPESAQINLCRITKAGWEPAEAQAPADAPSFDCNVAIQGRRSDDGSWTFDLAVFADRDDRRGFALVPAGSAVDFQVAFELG